MSHVGKNVFIAGNRLREDKSCIIDYYKGHHPFGLGVDYICYFGLDDLSPILILP